MPQEARRVLIVLKCCLVYCSVLIKTVVTLVRLIVLCEQVHHILIEEVPKYGNGEKSSIVWTAFL